jgi:Ion channel
MAKSKLESYDKINWISRGMLVDATNGELYVNGLYHIITTVVTVGFGDLEFFSTSEKLAAIVLMLVGNITFSMMQGHFNSILSNIDNVESEYL